MQRAAAVPTVAVALLAAALLAGCGGASSIDTETAVEAKAAEATTAAPETVAEAPTTEEQAASTSTAAAEPVADNAAAWAAIDAGAHAFAARMDQAEQAIASCQTDAAAGADFESCLNRSYAEIAAAANDLGSIIDGAGPTDGDCGAAVGDLRSAVQAIADDHARAAATKDRTSRETIKARLGDDAQSYVDAALATASTCAA